MRVNNCRRLYEKVWCFFHRHCIHLQPAGQLFNQLQGAPTYISIHFTLTFQKRNIQISKFWLFSFEFFILQAFSNRASIIILLITRQILCSAKKYPSWNTSQSILPLLNCFYFCFLVFCLLSLMPDAFEFLSLESIKIYLAADLMFHFEWKSEKTFLLSQNFALSRL